MTYGPTIIMEKLRFKKELETKGTKRQNYNLWSEVAFKNRKSHNF